MLVGQYEDRFQFDDNFFKADKIRRVTLRQNTPAVAEGERRFMNCWNSLIFEFDPQAFLINRLQKTTTLLVVNFETGADDRVALLLVNDFCHNIRVNSRDLRAQNLRLLMSFTSVVWRARNRATRMAR